MCQPAKCEQVSETYDKEDKNVKVAIPVFVTAHAGRFVTTVLNLIRFFGGVLRRYNYNLAVAMILSLLCVIVYLYLYNTVKFCCYYCSLHQLYWPQAK